MPYRQCKRPGCIELVPIGGNGYCPKHQRVTVENTRQKFDELKSRQSPAERRFYSSPKWTEASRRHRRKEPLCRQHLAAGAVVAATLVHHDPPLKELIAAGKNPLDDKYLVSLCGDCHMAELRSMKNS